MPATVGVVGLGIMGSAYAGHFVAGGCTTLGCDVDPAAVERLRARGGEGVASAAEAARRSELVMTALPSAAAFEAALFGEDGIAAGAHPGLVVVEASTLPLRTKLAARERAARYGFDLLDAPVSGTGSQAAVRDIAIYASGERAAYERALPLLEHVARAVRYVGAFGNGSKLKYIANLLVTIHNLSTAEAVVLAQKAGLDPLEMLEVVADGAGGSRMLQVRGPMMAAGRYDEPTMKLDVYQKDIEIIGDFAQEVGAPTPLFTQSTIFYTAALAQGRAKQDTAAIASILKTMAGLPADP
ncbi:MAG TPA: NAD(P)-dependent oxidoreductase [Candidatus Limnocylindria bacterium]|nr:NAD(P)-dependent oxidoreductase [Candidatus Limnocylindria bacterium]